MIGLNDFITLYRHQRTALNLLRLNDSFLLSMEQGTGKTLPSLYRIYELLRNKEINRALIVCPKSVIASWQRDTEKFTPEARELLAKQADIINYDAVWRHQQYKRQYDLILLDEAHSIVNRTSKRAEFLLRLSVTAKYRYLLTGTPIGNGRLEDTWSLFCFMDPYLVGSRIYSNIWKSLTGGKGSYYDWLGRYAYLDQYHKPFKYKHVREIQDLIADYSFSIKKIDCLDLPEKLPDELRILPLTEMKLYKSMAKDSAIESMDLIADNPLVKELYLRQIPSGHLKNVQLTTSKRNALLDVLAEIGEKKLVVFAEFTDSINIIKDVLDKEGISYITQDGKSDKDNWRRFQSDKTIRCIICQYASGYQGIDLYAADTVLYYEPTLRSIVLEQSRDRIHRNGQKNKCSYIHFLTAGTIEQQIYKTVSNYQDFTHKLFTDYMDTYQRAFRR